MDTAPYFEKIDNMEDHLLERYSSHIGETFGDLEVLAYACFKRESEKKHRHRYLVWCKGPSKYCCGVYWADANNVLRGVISKCKPCGNGKRYNVHKPDPINELANMKWRI